MTYDHGVTQNELDKFISLPDIEVVFDIGAKDNIEYLQLRPSLEYYLFEPNPQFYDKLVLKLKEHNYRCNVFNTGIGDFGGRLGFSTTHESFDGSLACPNGGGSIVMPLKRLDTFIEEFNVTKIDFIKIDTEGFELKIIQGNPKAIGMTKYLQYEHWGNENDEEIRRALPHFTFQDLGDRNIFCTRV